MMQTIRIKDKTSVDAITIGLAMNNYYVSAELIDDPDYKSHWEIHYCLKDEFEKSLIKEGEVKENG